MANKGETLRLVSYGHEADKKLWNAGWKYCFLFLSSATLGAVTGALPGGGCNPSNYSNYCNNSNYCNYYNPSNCASLLVTVAVASMARAYSLGRLSPFFYSYYKKIWVPRRSLTE